MNTLKCIYNNFKKWNVLGSLKYTVTSPFANATKTRFSRYLKKKRKEKKLKRI